MSVGLGTNGRLGHGGNENLDEPKEIEALNNVEISELAAGHRHSLALSSSGELYAWGYGGRTQSAFQYLPFLQTSSPNGTGKSGDVSVPEQVAFQEKITQITAGDDLSIAVGASGKIYGCGEGLSTIGEEASSTFKELAEISFFLDSHHAHVKKVRSTGKNVVVLLDDGRIYVSGKNNEGLFGTRQNPKIAVDHSFQGLTKIVDEDLKGHKIVDFEASDNSLIFKTDSGEVFYSGFYSKFRPERFPVKSGTAKSIFATHNSVGVIDESGRDRKSVV